MDFSKILDDWEKKGFQPSDSTKLDEEAPLSRPAELRREYERQRVEDRIDLHGMRRQEAIEALRGFLAESREEGLRKILIVHGKGLHSNDGNAVVRQLVQEELRRSALVQTFGVAERKDGGGGATWVILKDINVREK